MTRFRLLPLLVVGACLSQHASAQINPFRGTRATPLSADDLTALTDATNRLLDRQGLTAGAKETWRSPTSGASGTVTAGATTKQKGLACRIVHYDLTVPGPNSERNRKLTWCKTQNGWKLGS